MTGAIKGQFQDLNFFESRQVETLEGDGILLTNAGEGSTELGAALDDRVAQLARRLSRAHQLEGGEGLINQVDSLVEAFLVEPRKGQWEQRLTVLGKVLSACHEDLRDLLTTPEYQGLSTKNQVLLLESELEHMVNLGSIFELDLSNEGLTSIAPVIARIRNLRSLKLNGNCLRQLPVELSQLKNLQDVNLAKNSLERFPYQLLELPKLRNLDLRENSLRELPNAIGDVAALQSLKLCNNRLQYLPPDICGLRSLKILDCANNELLGLPTQIPQLIHLEQVDFRGNLFWEESAEMRVPLQSRVLEREELFRLLTHLGK